MDGRVGAVIVAAPLGVTEHGSVDHLACVGSPPGVMHVLCHHCPQIVARVELICFCAWIRQVPSLIELLGELHDALSGEAQLPGGLLLHLQRVQRHRGLPSPLLPLHPQHGCEGVVDTRLIQHDGSSVVEQTAPPPVKVTGAFAVRRLVSHLDLPERLSHKTLDLPCTLHDEAQGGKLAGPKTDEGTVVLYAARLPVKLRLQQQGLVAGEGGADAEVDFLPRIHRPAGRLVRRPQVCHRSSKVRLDESGEAGALDHKSSVGLLAHLDHLEGDVLALSVTVQPKHQPLRLTRKLLQVALQRRFVRGNTAHDRRREKVHSSTGAPGSVAKRKLQFHEVPAHTGHHHLKLLPTQVIAKLPNGIVWRR
mmetsp:Transcript_4752/g.13672  ORF Transcript_4752/g.13672 Transcript_4752/m.13672 type:complete len:364 (-) Transcript_4752:422-1513(-)